MMDEQRLQEIDASAEDHTTELIVALRQAWQDRYCAEAERNEWQTKYGNEHCRDCCCARLWRVLQNPLDEEAGHDGLVGAVWELRKERDEIARTHALLSDGLVQCMSEREHWRTRAEQAESIAGDAKTQTERFVAALTEARRVLREANVLLAVAQHYGSKEWLEDVVTLRQQIAAVLAQEEK